MKAKTGLLVLLLVLGMVLVLSGCNNLFGSDDEDEVDPENGNTTPDSEENNIESVRLADSLVIEASSQLHSDINFEASEVALADFVHAPVNGAEVAVSRSPVYRLRGSKEEFSEPVALTFTYDSEADPRNLSIVRFTRGEGNGEEYYAIETTVNEEEQTAQAFIYDFSSYGVFESPSYFNPYPEVSIPVNSVIDWSSSGDMDAFLSSDPRKGLFVSANHWGVVADPTGDSRGTVNYVFGLENGRPVADLQHHDNAASILLFKYENNIEDIESVALEFDLFVNIDTSATMTRLGHNYAYYITNTNRSGWMFLPHLIVQATPRPNNRLHKWDWRTLKGGSRGGWALEFTDDYAGAGWQRVSIDLTDLSFAVPSDQTVWQSSEEYLYLRFAYGVGRSRALHTDGIVPHDGTVPAGVYLDNIEFVVETTSGEVQEEPSLTISPSSGDHDAESDSGTISVSSNGSWSASANRSWISITSGSSDDGDGTVEYSVSENSSTSSRSGTITVSGGDISRSFSVTQSGASDEPDDAGSGTFSVSYSQVGSFTDEPGVKSVDYFGGTQAFGFGRSTCGASCFSNYAATLTIDLGEERYVSTLSFEQIEAYGNWGSSGRVTLDGETVSDLRLGGEPSNSGVADSEPRTSEVSIGQSVRQIEFYVSDITKQSEILIADIRIDGVLVQLGETEDSDDNSESAGSYSIGDTGPAGGVIFYDKGSSSDGWQYLEAAPSDIDVSGDYDHVWGGNQTGVNAPATRIGKGAANTTAIVDAYGASDPYRFTGNYAARLCDRYEYGGYDDWFLPSKDELNEMYQNKGVIGGFKSMYYWSSSGSYAIVAWYQYFDDGVQFNDNRLDQMRVRAIRAF